MPSSQCDVICIDSVTVASISVFGNSWKYPLSVSLQGVETAFCLLVDSEQFVKGLVSEFRNSCVITFTFLFVCLFSFHGVLTICRKSKTRYVHQFCGTSWHPPLPFVSDSLSRSAFTVKLTAQRVGPHQNKNKINERKDEMSCLLN